MSNALEVAPRVLRYKKAAVYCGVSERVFNADFRPHLREVKIGVQGIGFDRVEIDSYLDWLFKYQGVKKAQGGKSWKSEKRISKVSTLTKGVTRSTKSTAGTGFLRELALVTNKKP